MDAFRFPSVLAGTLVDSWMMLSRNAVMKSRKGKKYKMISLVKDFKHSCFDFALACGWFCEFFAADQAENN